ncbi:MAG: hypothetical protein II625_05075 [Bacilli bacterium]|nr:hypothetical protein [Bacilli bacterium]
MKNAIGELNGSVITVVAVASLTVLFFTFIWPMLKQNLKKDANCSNAVCDVGYNTNMMVWCYNPDDITQTYFECPFKG